MKINPFHLAIPVYDLVAAFYGQVFGCAEGGLRLSGSTLISSVINW